MDKFIHKIRGPEKQRAWDFAHQPGDEYLLTGWRGNRRVREQYYWHREALLQPIDDGSLWLLRNGERKLLARTRSK